MTHYSMKPTDRIFVKGYGFLSFAKNMSKNVKIYVKTSAANKYSQKLLDK